MKMTFGKYQGLDLEQVYAIDASYIAWLFGGFAHGRGFGSTEHDDLIEEAKRIWKSRSSERKAAVASEKRKFMAVVGTYNEGDEIGNEVVDGLGRSWKMDTMDDRINIVAGKWSPANDSVMVQYVYVVWK